MSKKISALRGFTLSEILLVVTIIAVLAVVAILSYQRQVIRGYDSKRKTDFSKLRTIFEDYYNDHNEYPGMGDWYVNYATKCVDGSGIQFLAPYLQGQNIPCDPVTNKPYLYLTINQNGEIDPSVRSQYKLFAALGNLQDPDIPGSGCSPDPYKGCGYVESDCDYCSPKYNYGISMGTTIANPTFDFNAPPPTPTPPGAPGDNFCLGDPNPEHACNTKAGLIAPDYGNRPCTDVLRELGCTSFLDGGLCTTKCQTAYATYTCPQTQTVRCW